MFRDHFSAEVDYLFQLCEELGRREPHLAPILGRGADPSVTRLIEGLAFSFGRLRQRLDDDVPESIHPVVDNLCPEMLCPIPASTIVELVPSPKMMSRQLVRAGSTFASRPIDGVSCVFRSTIEVDVSPCVLRRVEISPTERRAVKMVLELFEGSELSSALSSSLRIFLAHPTAMALEARAFLLRAAQRVVVRSPQSREVLELPPPKRSEVGVRSAKRAPLPIAAAFLDLRDYFLSPRGFAFLELPGFDAVTRLGAGVRQIEIDIELSEPVPKGISFDLTSVVLHAVPVVNVFRAPKSSFPLSGDKRRCLVLFDDEFADAQVYSVESVAIVSRDLRRIPLSPWARFFPLDLDAAATPRYEVHRTPSVVGPALDVSLSFKGGELEAFLADKVSVEVEVLATNGQRAASVCVGDVCVPTATSPSLVSFRNITAVTRNVAPALAGDRAWRFYGFMKANGAALADTPTLQTILAFANVPALDQWPEAKPGVEAFAPLSSVKRRRSFAPSGEELQRGAEIEVRVDARAFTGTGDLELFGEVLAPLFAATISRHEWIELALLDGDGRLLWRSPRVHGARVGL